MLKDLKICTNKEQILTWLQQNDGELTKSEVADITKILQQERQVINEFYGNTFWCCKVKFVDNSNNETSSSGAAKSNLPTTTTSSHVKELQSTVTHQGIFDEENIDSKCRSIEKKFNRKKPGDFVYPRQTTRLPIPPRGLPFL